MNVRVFYSGTTVVAIECDPSQEYTEEFFPFIFLKDKNDPSQGYENVPAHFVCDESAIPNGVFENMRVRDIEGGKEPYIPE